MSDTTDRALDRGTPPERFARGWHCLGLAGTSATASRTPSRRSAASSSSGPTRQGELHVLDGYCRHMGGDLTQGTVKGDEIACPFHDWRWGGDGKCKAIPYARRVPLRARTQRTTTRRAQRPAAGLARRRGQRRPTTTILPPELEGIGTGRVDRLDLEGHRRPERALPRDHRQRRRHGALLLHPLRLPDELPQRVRGPHRDAVHGVDRPARHGRRGVRRRGPACSSRRRPTTGRRT